MPKIIWSDYSDGTPCHVEYWGDGENKHSESETGFSMYRWMEIKFQANPVSEVGHNGMCMLDIIDAIIKRLEDFQVNWPCEENEMAISALIDAQNHLKDKRARRLKESRGQLAKVN